MRCSCRSCEDECYMIHSEGDPACVCPSCGARCTDCLGTDTLIDRAVFQTMKEERERENRGTET